MRLEILRNIIFLFIATIILALFYMQIIRGGGYHEQSLNNRIRVIPLEAPRGRILDRNGIVLADNIRSFNAAVIPQDIEDKDEIFAYLGNIFKKDSKELKKLFVRRKLTPFDPVVLVQDIDRATAIRIQEDRFRFPGLVIQETFERRYPFQAQGAHVIGYVGKIDPSQAEAMQEYGYTPTMIVGKTGVEQYYDGHIQGITGGRQIEVNSRGVQVRLLGLKDPLKGKDISLTVDGRLQNKAMQLLDGRRGSIVIMDVSTGDILTLISSPAFDPNVFTDRSRRAKITEYMSSSISPLINRAVSGQFPPGSVFKIPVALAAIERKMITPETIFDCPGYYMLGTARFGCAHEHGKENLLQAIAHSCNVYFFHIGQKVTAPIIGAYAKAFGFGRLSGIDLPSEATGKVVLPAQRKGDWYTGNTLNLSIGQGDLLATPLQVTLMMAAVANDGIMLRPRILKAVDARIQLPPDLSKRPIIRLHNSTWRIVQNGLRQVVDDAEGTGHLLKELTGMAIWGKTGTAQAGKGQEHHAWFAGYVRSPKANLAYCVFLEHGGASTNAVIVTRDLLEYLQVLGLI